MSQASFTPQSYRSDGTQATEIRLILARGHQRLRAMRNQGYRPSGVERILNLMRDLRVVPLDNVIIKIPLVYAAEWKNKGPDPSSPLNPRRNFVTSFARAQQFSAGIDQAEMQIHRVLVSALRKYLVANDSGGFLVDVTGLDEASPLRYDHSAYHAGSDGYSHPLFKGTDGELPKVLKEVQALIRITFPLDKQTSAPPKRVGSIILGISLHPPATGGWDGDGRPPEAVIKQLGMMADVLVKEVPEIYDQFKPVGIAAQGGGYAPDFVEELESDELHAAVDELHEQIADLAARRGLTEWRTLQPPHSGYNFLIAFRQLDSELQGCLRYCLTRPNQTALRQNIASGTLLDRERYATLSRSGFRLFSRGDAALDARMHEEFWERCWGAVNEVLRDREHGEAAREFKRRVESSPYPLHLTPGYSVMTRGYPELVKDWLGDPRARNFESYPPLLLAWESLALPRETETYYSPITDGNIKFAICGVGAELLYRGGGFELQELIDNSGARFRDIICNNLVVELKKDLFNARVHGVSGYELWKKAWFHFRQLAYYYLPDGNDYLTMLVDDDALRPFDEALQDAGKSWRPGQTMTWWFLHGQMDTKLVSALRGVQNYHSGLSEAGRHDTYLKDYIGNDHDLRNARLYKIKLRNASTLSMLVLVPSPEHHQRATSLLSRFTIACGDALSFYDDESSIVVSSSEFGHQSVYLLRMLGAKLSCLTCCPLMEVRLVTEVLQNEVDYFANRIENITSGAPITVDDLFRLLLQIKDAIHWGLEVTRGDVRGSLSGIGPRKVQLLEESVGRLMSTKGYARIASRAIGVSRSAALFLMWEIAINLCKHAKSKIKFLIRADGRLKTSFKIESDMQDAPMRLTGRYGIEHLQHVAKLIGAGFDSGPTDDNSRVFRQCITFEKRGNRG